MKHTIEGFITYTKGPWSDKPEIGFSQYAPLPGVHSYTVMVKPHSIEVEVPDDFEPNKAKIDILEEAKRLKKETYLEERAMLDQAIKELSNINMYSKAV